MFRIDFGHYKYLGLFLALNVTFLLISNFTASRLVTIYGISMSVTVLYFPLTYLIADILTEVYGYAKARSIIWLSIFCSIVAAIVTGLSIQIPAADIFKDDAAYQQIFSSAPRIAIAGLLAVFSGDMCNCYVLAKMKVANKGNHLWARFVASTIIGEGVNTVVFFGTAFYGVFPDDLLVHVILVGWIAKSLVEIVLLPVTYPIVAWLKKIENVDYFDTKTNFNPFIIDSGK